VTEPQTIRADQFLAHPPGRVWHALTDPDLMARWLMPNDFKLEIGHQFTFHTTAIPAADFDGIVYCEVIDFEPERRLAIRWANRILDTTVTWHLVPEGRGTRLFVEHAGFDLEDETQAFAFKNMDGGWRSRVFRGIERVLDGLERV
jgi:uncharacterized protein YndB with AHSA1/START domain